MTTILETKRHRKKYMLLRGAVMCLTKDGQYLELGTREAHETRDAYEWGAGRIREDDASSDADFGNCGKSCTYLTKHGDICLVTSALYCPNCKDMSLGIELYAGRKFSDGEKVAYLYYMATTDEIKNEIVARFNIAPFSEELQNIFDTYNNEDAFQRRVSCNTEQMLCPQCCAPLPVESRKNRLVSVCTACAKTPLSETLWEGNDTVSFVRSLMCHIPGYRLSDPWKSPVCKEAFIINMKSRLCYYREANGKHSKIFGVSNIMHINQTCNMAEIFKIAFPILCRYFSEIDIDNVLLRYEKSSFVQKDPYSHTAFEKEYLVPLQILINKIRYPLYTDNFHVNLLVCQHLDWVSPYPGMKPFVRRLGRIQTADELVSYAQNKLHVGKRYFTKRDKALIFDDPTTILVYDFASRIGITDHNAIRNNKDDLFSILCRSSNDICSFLAAVFSDRWSPDTIHMVARFLADDSWILTDSVHMRDKILSRDPSKLPQLHGNLKDIHDTLSKAWNLLQHKNVGIGYAEEDYCLERAECGYDFILPADTRSLLLAGQHLENCVASYAEEIFEKRCRIVLGLKAGKPEICIELTPGQCAKKRGGRARHSCLSDFADEKTEWHLAQVKGRFNEPLTDEQATAFLHYVNSCRIKTDHKCRDYQDLLLRPVCKTVVQNLASV